MPDQDIPEVPKKDEEIAIERTMEALKVVSEIDEHPILNTVDRPETADRSGEDVSMSFTPTNSGVIESPAYGKVNEFLEVARYNTVNFDNPNRAITALIGAVELLNEAENTNANQR